MTAPDPVRLRKAADIIRTGGLAKHVFDNEKGAHCTLGALMAVDRGSRWVREISLLVEMLGHSPESNHCVISAWNDKPERTAEDVIGLLEQAAEKLEAEL